MRQHHPVQPRRATGFGFEEVIRDPDYTRFMAWYRRSSLLAPGRAAVVDVFSRPYAVEAGIEPLEQAA
jgi:hypothetical protein